MNFELWNSLSFLKLEQENKWTLNFDIDWASWLLLCVQCLVVVFCLVMEIKMLDDKEIDFDTCTRSSF